LSDWITRLLPPPPTASRLRITHLHMHTQERESTVEFALCAATAFFGGASAGPEPELDHRIELDWIYRASSRGL